MANAFPTHYRSRGLKVTGWLLFAALAGALTIFVWIGAAVKPAVNLKKTVADAPSIPDPLIKLSTTNPNEMAQAVKPISFDAVVRDMRNYPPQFTDSRYLKSNSTKWTVQVMNVAEHDVVTDYINGREDKDNFKYFRIEDEQQQKRYVVTYGLYGSKSEAAVAAVSVNFGLPSNVATFAEEMRSYLAQVDDYEINPPVSDLGAKAPKEVKLHSTPKVIPAPVAKTKPTTDEEQTAATDDNTADKPATTDSKARNTEQNIPTTPPAQSRQPSVPTRPAPRGETLVIQDKPVPAFEEKPTHAKPDSSKNTNQHSKPADTKNGESKTGENKPNTKTSATAEKPKKSENTAHKPDRINDLIKEKNQ